MLAKITNNVAMRSIAFGVLSVWIASVGLACAIIAFFYMINSGHLVTNSVHIPNKFDWLFQMVLLKSLVFTSLPGAIAACLLSFLFRIDTVKKKLSTKKSILIGSGLGVFIAWSIVEYFDFSVRFFPWDLWIFFMITTGILAALAGGWTAGRIYGLINRRQMT